eukprot:12879215-Ditylum_brightwellii.AAC.1
MVRIEGALRGNFSLSVGEWILGVHVCREELGTLLLEGLKRNKIRCTVRHVANFSTQGWQALTPNMKPSKHHKVKYNGTLGPMRLLSNVSPLEEVLSPGPSYSGWTRQTLKWNEVRNSFDLVAFCPDPPLEWEPAGIRFVAWSAPCKIIAFFLDNVWALLDWDTPLIPCSKVKKTSKGPRPY